ncbi:MAG: hypothetical protein R3E66_13770 [bacterium]
MAQTIRDRVDRLVREALDSHVDLLAVLLAETGLESELQVARLDRLICALQARRFEPTIFEEGRRMPTSVDFSSDPPAVLLNEELLGRVSDDEVLSALARPIGQILEVAPVSVAVALQIRDDRFIKNLTTKASRRSDQATVRANDIPAFVEYKMEVFGTRLATLAKALGREHSFDLVTNDETLAALGGRASWPEWADVGNLRLSGQAIEGLRTALVDTVWSDSADKLCELVWDSLALSGQTFLRHAGRDLRGENVPQLTEVLSALLAAVAEQERTLSDDPSTWAVYTDVHEAWLQLDDAERRTFGVSVGQPDRRPVSVVGEAGVCFGLSEPASLPWDVPLVCWTVREQSALRDLFVGISKTLPNAAKVHFFPLSALNRDEPRLQDGDASAWSLQIASSKLEVVSVDSDDIARAYASALATLTEQFVALPLNHQDEAIRRLRKAYDDYFPDWSEIWTRRFAGTRGSSFHELLTGIQHMVSSPIMFDPFMRPSNPDLAPYPTLTTIVAREPDMDAVPFWVPISILGSTQKGPPVRVRLIRVAESGCAWESDKTVSLPKLDAQPVDLVLNAVHGDSLQFVMTRDT